MARSPSPGHQAGAPLRRLAAPGPTTVRPGLPPAIRPGLHCGVLDHVRCQIGHLASPGHQAGAPLRPRHRPGARHLRAHFFPRPSGRGSIAALCDRGAVAPCCATFPRPSGRGSIAAPHRGTRAAALADFPRPSGRGSIAAPSWRFPPRSTRTLPPAIRPGLHCGYERNLDIGGKLVDFPRPSGRGSIAASAAVRSSISACIFPRPSGRGSIAAHTAALPSTEAGRPSPGHQAGAPLRLAGLERLHVQGEPLPPAIRPGLHCGGGMNETTETQWASSPGHQAGAPLRHAATRR